MDLTKTPAEIFRPGIPRDLPDVITLHNETIAGVDAAQTAADQAKVIAAGAQPLKLAPVLVVASGVNLSAPGATIDGVTMPSGGRFCNGDAPDTNPIVAGSATATTGIYVWNGASVAATRAADADSAAKIGMACFDVLAGTRAGKTIQFQQKAADITTFGTTPVSVKIVGDTSAEVTARQVAIAAEADARAVAIAAVDKKAPHSTLGSIIQQSVDKLGFRGPFIGGDYSLNMSGYKVKRVYGNAIYRGLDKLGFSRDVLPSSVTTAGASHYLNAEKIRDTRMRISAIKNGYQPLQLSVAQFGDSYTDTWWITASMRSKLAVEDGLGHAADGYSGFGWGSLPATGTWTLASQPVGRTATYIGTWTGHWNDTAVSTLRLSYASSSTAGAYIDVTFTAGHTGCDLYYAGDGTGVVKCSWDGGGTWSSNITLTTAGPSYAALAGIPSGAGTLRIQVVSGNVTLAGICFTSNAPGAVVHQLATGSLRAWQLAAVDPTQWRALLAHLAPTWVSIMLGPNDQFDGRTPEQFVASIATIATNVRSALPACDLLLKMPPENPHAVANNLMSMKAYTAAVRAYAQAEGIAFIDYQMLFGDDPADYSYPNTARPWIGIDLLHPTFLGSMAVVDGEHRMMFCY